MPVSNYPVVELEIMFAKVDPDFQINIHRPYIWSV